ncbi:hypothetical protein SISNIDRAFT_393720, partial [Sistotremastrum niveocremeum HHB9708]
GIGSNPRTYTPNSLQASQNDIIQFVFSGSPGLHSVTQSNFENPCQPLPGGFSSGFVSVSSGSQGPFMAYEIRIVNASQPIWYYCAQTNPEAHCLSGMSGVINPP